MPDVLNEVHTPQTVIRLIKHMQCQKCHFWAQYFWAQKGVLETKIIILEGNCNIFGMCGFSCVWICEMVAAEAD